MKKTILTCTLTLVCIQHTINATENPNRLIAYYEENEPGQSSAMPPNEIIAYGAITALGIGSMPIAILYGSKVGMFSSALGYLFGTTSIINYLWETCSICPTEQTPQNTSNSYPGYVEV